MAPQTIDTSAARAFIERHREKLYIGAILYLFGVNQEQKSQLTKANERVEKSEAKYEEHRNREIEAANRIAFRSMQRSDTVYLLGADTAFRIPAIARDSTKR